MKMEQIQKLAQSQGLVAAKDIHWGQVRIQAATGATLVVTGIDNAPAWIAGYAAGRASMQPCPNPACRGGFVGGEDPHPCGQC